MKENDKEEAEVKMYWCSHCDRYFKTQWEHPTIHLSWKPVKVLPKIKATKYKCAYNGLCENKDKSNTCQYSNICENQI